MRISVVSVAIGSLLLLKAHVSASELNESESLTSSLVTQAPVEMGMYNEEFRIKALVTFINCDEFKIESLMEKGYDVFTTGIWDELIREDNVKTVEYLLKYHFRDTMIRRRALRDALVHGSESIAKVVLDKYKASVKPESEEEQTTLVKMAYDRYYYNVIEKMRKERFSLNAILPDNEGRSILHDAIISNNARMVKLLLKFDGVNYDVKDDLGNTPLHYAKNMKMCKALLDLYANPFVKNEVGINSIFMAQPSVNARYELFQYTMRNVVSKYAIKTFVLDRERVLEDSFYLASRESDWYDVSSVVNISFKGESGIDGGGLKREWMSLLIERFFVSFGEASNESTKKPARANEAVTLVTPVTSSVNLSVVDLSQMTLRELIMRSSRVYANSDEVYYGAPFECIDTDNKFYRISLGFTGPVEVYKFIGSIMAKALLIRVPLRVKLVPSLVKLLYGQRLVFEDLKDDDPVMYRSMLQCLEPGADYLGVEDVMGLLEERAMHAMYTRCKDQIDAFVEGFNLIFGREMLGAFFTPAELHEILSGDVEIDRADLYRNIEISGRYWQDRSAMFWAALDSLTEKELFDFVRFVTGINGLPFGGVSSLGKKIEIQDEPVHNVPKAAICIFTLRIPTSIASVEELVGMFRMAFESGPEFTD